MNVDPSSSPPMDESTLDEENHGENSNSMPGSTEQVTESGTSIDSETSELWLEFKCVFCNQDLKNITRPKLLSCLHTACESCLNAEVSNTESAASSSVSGRNYQRVKKRTRKGGNKHLVCPSCSQDINIDETVDHLFLVEYVQNSESLPEECSYTCSCEEGAEGTSFCMECQEWLCESCVTAHRRVRVTKDHVVRPKEEMDGENMANRNQKYLFCPVHSHEQLRLYCETCDKLTCRDCQLSDHKEHKYQFLEKACEDERGLIEELLIKIKERQESLEAASDNLNRRNEEIKEREKVITQEIKTFAVKYITDINKRAKVLLQDLNKVCTSKKNELSVKNQELNGVSDKLKHCQKFAEAAMSLGSETALVYSKKPIMNQLRRILRHRCEVPNSNQMIDMSFEFESSFLTNYISTIGKILLDKQPLPGSANQNIMLPMPNTISQSSSIPTPPPIRQQPQMQQMNTARQVQAPLAPPIQQMHHQQVPYGQPQVTSSTDMARNHNNMRQVNNNMRQVNNTVRMRQTIVQSPQQNLNIQNNASFQQQRQVQHQQQTQIRQQHLQSQVQQQQRIQQQQHQLQQLQQQQQQAQQQQQQQHNQQLQVQQQQQQYSNNSVQLPMPLRQNKSLSVTAVPVAGPSPNKQRAIAPRSNMSVTTQGSPSSRSNPSAQNNAPQVIVLDDQPNQKTMSNTSRLSHFPSNIAATLAANPSLQIQPAFNNNSSKF